MTDGLNERVREEDKSACDRTAHTQVQFADQMIRILELQLEQSDSVIDGIFNKRIGLNETTWRSETRTYRS